MARFEWETGVAEVTSSRGRTVTVACPHCPESHDHDRDVVGSNAVVAGCHKGWNVCREYRVVDYRKKRR
jgi:hypothetical protein